jgi:hypothetical protein
MSVFLMNFKTIILLLCFHLVHISVHNNHYWACLDVGVSVSLKQTNTKTNTFHPNTCVSLVLVGTNTPKKLTPLRGGNWC